MSSAQVTESATPRAGNPESPPGSGPGRTREWARRGWRDSLGPFILIVPMLASLLAVSLYPVLRTVWLAFRNTNLETQGDKFTGLTNLHKLAHDAIFWKAWRQTLEFTAVTTIIETLLGLVIALALYKTFRGRGFVRAAVLVPWAIPTVVTARMFSWLFDQGGVVNYLLVELHLVAHPVNFLGSTTLALPTLMVADIWKTTPFVAIIVLAGLVMIPRDYYEAAEVDGASGWRAFWRITFPLLRPTIALAVLFRVLQAFGLFDLPFVLTLGGPGYSTQPLAILAYNAMFRDLDFGPGAAVATSTALLVVIGCLVFLRVFRAQAGTEA
jgi:ABC-type sugar transport system permease subunit